MRIAGQLAKASGEPVDAAAGQAERPPIRVSEGVPTKRGPHQASPVVIRDVEQHMTDFVSEDAAERARQLAIQNHPRRPIGGSTGQHTFGRVERHVNGPPDRERRRHHDMAEDSRPFRRPPRLGLVRQFYLERADSELRAHVEAQAERLARAGASVQEVKLPDSFRTHLAAHRVISGVETSAVHTELFRTHADLYRPRLRAALEVGALIPGTSYLQAQRIRRLIRHDLTQLLQQVEFLLMPAAPGPAPQGLGTTGDPSFNALASLTGLPAITIPSGLNAAGMPLAIQLLGPAMADDQLLAAARWCEATLDITLVPPLAAPTGTSPSPEAQREPAR